MKNLLSLSLIAFALFVAGCKPPVTVTPPPPPNKDWAVTLTFNYDFTNYAKCGGSVTKGCITGFSWGYLQGSTQIPLKTSTTAICTGSTQPVACTDTTNSTFGLGTTTPYVVANGLDNNGNAITSTQGAGSAIPIPFVAASNIGMTLQ